MIFRKTLATVVFEFSRSLTTSRITTSAVLALFAPVMLTLIGLSINRENQIAFPLLVLGVFHLLAIFLAVLLWATPVVYSELEGKTWTYLAIRPNGKLASTLGKFVNAVFWATITATISLTLSCLVVNQFPWAPPDMVQGSYRGVGSMDNLNSILLHSSDPIVIWYSLFPALLLGSMTLSAIFVHIGLITHKRGMVFAVGYGIADTFFSFLPALVQQFTVGFHVRTIAFKISGFDFPEVNGYISTGDYSTWVHALILLVITGVHLVASIWWLHAREYITAEEV